MIRIYFAAAALFLLGWPTLSVSASFSSMTGAWALERDCAGLATGFDCLTAFPSVPRQDTFGGDYGQKTGSVSAGGDVSTATITANALLGGNPMELPTLGVFVDAGADSKSSARATGARLLKWLGPATTLEFGGTVTYEQSGDCSLIAGTENPGAGCIWSIVTALDSSWNPDTSFPSGFGIDAQPGDILAMGEAQGGVSGSPSSFEVSLLLDVQPGDAFYLAAELVGGAFRGGVADSSSTFLPFVRSNDLTQGEILEALVPVPVPGAVWMLLSGLGVLGGLARRRSA